MRHHRGLHNDWRDNFTNNAADLIQIHRWIGGDEVAKLIIVECFKRRPTGEARINSATVERVLYHLNFQIDDEGVVTRGDARN